MNRDVKYNQLIWWLIGVSFIVRFIFAFFLEFGNDEVYYWLLSAYPAMSYFDHPPLLFVFINLFSFFHLFDAEWAIRLPSLIAVTASTWLIYDIGCRVKSTRIGFMAALLAQCSFYFFIIGGVFIIPDGVLSFFWLAAIRSVIIFFNNQNSTFKRNTHLILFGLFVGLGAITKYHILVLWFSFGLFILHSFLYNKQIFKTTLKNYRLYISVLISILSLAPVIIWNIENDFSSFKFHESRLSFFGEFRPLFLMREFFGQFVYNNFFVFVLAYISVFSWRKRNFVDKEKFNIIIWFSIPLIVLFLFFSAFRATLPHWSAPGYFMLIVLVSAYLDDLNKKKFPRILSITIAITSVLYILAFVVISKGYFVSNTEAKNDVTLDMYGWNQLAYEFEKRSDDYPISTKYILANKWYNAAHIDYYICRKTDFDLMCVGDIGDIHEYQRINKIRGLDKPPKEAFFIKPQRAGKDPSLIFSEIYSNIECVDTIPIYRNNKIAQKIMVYVMESY